MRDIKTLVMVSTMLCTTITSAYAESLSESAVLAQGRAASAELMAQLGSRLKAAMKQGGPATAVEVCHADAQPLTAQTSEKLALSVGRTAQRVRNPNNAPDGWESKQLEVFETALAEGVSADDLEVAQRFDMADGTSHWRYMKPIMTAGLCLACHGNDLQPDVAQAIAARYPTDQAVGFEVGDLRGAFTITISE